MKWIEKPNWSQSVKDGKVFEYLSDPEVIQYLNRVNSAYYHWAEMRHRPFPKNLNGDLAWAVTKISRLSQMRYLDFTSTSGHRFSYWLPDGVLKELHLIDQNAAGNILVDHPPRSKDRERYIISSLMEEAIASSILEGAATTRTKAKEMLREGRAPRSRAEQMIKNNYITMSRIKQDASRDLSVEFLCDLQGEITKDTLEDSSASGRLRTAAEQVRVVDMQDGAVLHVPPPADELKERLAKLCAFANQSSEDSFIHPVVKASILHFWLAYEHPFVDGNGRTSRAIFYWYLIKNKYWLAEFLPISRIILKAPSKYKMAFLYAEKDDEDITYFLRFQLRAFRLSIEDLKQYVRNKQEELSEAARMLKRLPGLNHRQHEIISHAIRHPDTIYTIARHMTTHNVVYQTARADLLLLVKRGLFTKKKVGRNFVFFAHDELDRKLKSKNT